MIDGASGPDLAHTLGLALDASRAAHTEPSAETREGWNLIEDAVRGIEADPMWTPPQWAEPAPRLACLTAARIVAAAGVDCFIDSGIFWDQFMGLHDMYAGRAGDDDYNRLIEIADYRPDEALANLVRHDPLQQALGVPATVLHEGADAVVPAFVAVHRALAASYLSPDEFSLMPAGDTHRFEASATVAYRLEVIAKDAEAAARGDDGDDTDPGDPRQLLGLSGRTVVRDAHGRVADLLLEVDGDYSLLARPVAQYLRDGAAPIPPVRTHSADDIDYLIESLHEVTSTCSEDDLEWLVAHQLAYHYSNVLDTVMSGRSARSAELAPPYPDVHAARFREQMRTLPAATRTIAARDFRECLAYAADAILGESERSRDSATREAFHFAARKIARRAILIERDIAHLDLFVPALE